jgi:Outer membrane lipoprotein-sorting protein
MKRIWMGLALLLAGAAHAQDDARKVLECMRANMPAQLAIRSLELVAHDRTGGTRTIKGHLYMAKSRAAEAGKDLISAALYIDLPMELKGAAYLVKETDDYLRDGMFVYLPAVKRVRRITGTFADGALMGTNFSYFDFKQLQNAFSDVSATREGTADVHGRRAHVLVYKVLEGTETRYTGGKLWVDEEACVVVKGEFYEANRRLAKTFTSPAGALKKVDGAWYLSEVEMQEPATGSKTIARIGKLDTKAQVPTRYFDPNLFHLGQ